VVDVEVAYQADVDGAIRVIRDEAEGFARAPAWGGKLQGAPEVPGVISIGDGGVTIRALIRTVPGAQWEVGREFRRRVKNRLDQEAIPIPYPQRMVRVRLEEEGGRRPPAPRPDGA
jgi:small conductance mechanosensitive channel